MKNKITAPTSIDKPIGMLSDKERLLQDAAFNRCAYFLAQMIMKYAGQLDGTTSAVDSSAERTIDATEAESMRNE